MKVEDVAHTEGFSNGNSGIDDYAYDLNGNLIEDKNKEIVQIGYNYLNLPEMIEFVSPPNVERDRIAYIYSAEGVKLQKLVITNNSATIVSTDYAGNYIYEDGVLKMFFQPEGYVEPVDPNDYSQGFSYAYQYKDIWRNVRLSYSDSNGDGNIDPATEIREVASYYPFGMRFGHNVLSGSGNDYKTYQGQEFTDELGLNVHEWKYRISDPAIGRFWQVDPLAEKYPYNSTYAFQENKLGIGVELEGLEVFNFTEAAEENNWGNWGKRTAGFADQILNNANGVVIAVNTLESISNSLENIQSGNGSVGDYVNATVPFSGANAVIGIGQTAIAAINGNEAAQGALAGMVVEAVVGGEIVKSTTKATPNVSNRVSNASTNTDFVVTSDGTTVPIPDNAMGPTNPNSGTGMMYQGGSGGKGMSSRTTGVRIMDSNSNQGRRVNYMNNSIPTPQTVDPVTGNTISNKDPRGHLPIPY